MFKTTQKLSFIGLLVAILLWSISLSVMKVTVEQFGPMTTVFLRLLIASGCLIFFLPSISKQPVRLGDIKWLILMALLEPCLYFVFEGYALKFTTASEAGMITAIQPLLIAFGAWLFLKELPSKKLLAGSFIALIGVLIISLNGTSTESAPNPLLGNLLETVAMFMAAGYALITRHLSQYYSALFLTTTQAFVGSIFFMPLALFTTEITSVSINFNGVISLVFLGVGVNVVAFFLYNTALKEISASKISIWLNLIPIGSLFFGWLLLNEKFLSIQYFGAFVVLAGLYFSQLRRKPAKTVQEDIDENVISDPI